MTCSVSDVSGGIERRADLGSVTSLEAEQMMVGLEFG